MNSEKLLRDLQLSLALEQAKVRVTDVIKMLKRIELDNVKLRARCDRLQEQVKHLLEQP